MVSGITQSHRTTKKLYSLFSNTSLTTSTALGIASPAVRTTPNTTLETGQTITVSGDGFNVLDDAPSGMFDTPITANITTGGITVASGRTLQQIAAGVSVEIPDVSAGTQTVKVITNISGLTADANIICADTPAATSTPAPTATSTATPTATAPTNTDAPKESTFSKTTIIVIIVLIIIAVLVLFLIIRRREDPSFRPLSYFTNE